MQVTDIPNYIRQANAISFVIGAGASKSAGIPLATDLIKMIERDYNHCLGHLSVEERSNYGKVMSALSPQERKNLIEPLLSASKLNWGHVALARIIQESEVKRVLSFNFDFLLERAISLLGDHLTVYDFGIAPAKNISGLADKAIFHLHGQSYGLKLLNSEEETADHAESLRPLISDSLCNHVTIVTGYSGGADGAFKIMRDSYNGDNRLFWLGHGESPNHEIAPLFDNPYAFYIGGCDFDLSMIEIARGLNCWPIPIIENPPNYVRTQLATLPPFPVGEENETAILHETQMHLSRMSTEWEEGRTDEEREAAALMANLPIDNTENWSNYSQTAKEMRSWRFVSAAEKLHDKASQLIGDAKAEKFDQAYQKYEEAVRIKPDMHEAFYNWGAALSDEAKGLEGQARAEKLDQACQKYAEAVRIKPDEHEAFNNWGNALSDEAKGLEGQARAEKLDQACQKYAEAVRIKPDMHEAFNNWGNALSNEAKGLEGQARAEKLDQACQKYKEAVRIKPDMHQAFNNWGTALSDETNGLEGQAKAEKFDQAYQKYEEAVRIKPDMHEAFYNWGAALSDEAKGLEGQARAEKLDQACQKYAEAVRIKPDMHEAFNNWGAALSDETNGLEGQAKAEKFDQAYQKYEEAVRIKPDKHEAFYNWGAALSDEAKGLEGQARAEKLDQACQKYAEAVRIKPDMHVAFNNWGASLSDEAKELEGQARAEKFDQAYQKYAEAVRIKPELYDALDNWGAALSDEAKGMKGDARADKLNKATELLEQAKEITGLASYNFACILALNGNIENAIDELENCVKDGTIPTIEHLRLDQDMDNLRHQPRFQALIAD